jgi:hypothetical protein
VLPERNGAQRQAGAGLAGALKVTPTGAVASLATVCSVPLTAAVPTPISSVVPANGVLALMNTTAAVMVSAALALCRYTQRYSTRPAAACAALTASNSASTADDMAELDLTPPSETWPSALAAPPDRRVTKSPVMMDMGRAFVVCGGWRYSVMRY